MYERLPANATAAQREAHKARAKARKKVTQARWRDARKDQVYVEAHAGETPDARMQLQAAQGHNIPIDARAPLVINQQNLLGQRQNVVVRNLPPLALDAANPRSWASLIAFFAARDSAATLAVHVEKITRVFKELGFDTKQKQPSVETIKDVGPYFLTPQRLFDVCDNLKLLIRRNDAQKGDPMDLVSRFMYTAAVCLVGSQWDELVRLPGYGAGLAKVYADHFSVANKEKGVRSAAKVAGYTQYKWADLMGPILDTFGDDSMEALYMRIYEVAPLRDDCGRLELIPDDSKIRVGKLNFLIDKSANHQGMMTFYIQKHKKWKTNPQLIRVIPDDVARLIRRYIASVRPAPKFLFSKARDHSKPFGSMSSWVKAMLEEVDESIATSTANESINVLRRSWSKASGLNDDDAAAMMGHSRDVHDRVYLQRLRNALDNNTGS